MKYFNMMVVLTLLISLIMNFTLSSKLDNVENQLMNLSNNQQQILSGVNGQVDQIRFVMNDIQKQQSWISEIKMDVKSNQSQNEKAIANFEWQIKELHQNSKVMFNYTFGEDEKFTSIPVEKGQNGLFQVEIPFNVKIEPPWEIFIHDIDSGQQKKEMEEKRDEEYNRNSMKYFVSVSYDDVVKSSEIGSWYLGELGTEYYGILNIDVDLHNKQTTFILSNYNNNSLEKVYLQLYKNETLMDEQEMKSESANFLITTDKNVKDVNRFVVKVVYKNGEAFEKEVYKK